MNYTPTITDYRNRLADLLGAISRDYPNQAGAIIGPELANFPELSGSISGSGAGPAQGLLSGGLPSLGFGRKRKGASTKRAPGKKKKMRVRRDDEGFYVEPDSSDEGQGGDEAYEEDGISMDGSISMDADHPYRDPVARAIKEVFGLS